MLNGFDLLISFFYFKLESIPQIFVTVYINLYTKVRKTGEKQMNAKQQKRIGVIGYGQIGSSLHELMSEDLAGDMQVIGINESNSKIAAKIAPDLFQPTIA